MGLRTAYIAIPLILTALTAGCSKPAASVVKSGTNDSGKADMVTTTPFGIDISMPFSDIIYVKEKSDLSRGLYELKEVPKPAPDFEHYGVLAYPEVGICGVIARTKIFDGDTLGINARDTADRIAEALTAKYGKPTKVDKCLGGEPFCDSDNWSMAVMNGQRFYEYEWNQASNSNNVRTVLLGIDTTKFSDPIVALAYRVNDKKACEGAMKANTGKNL